MDTEEAERYLMGDSPDEESARCEEHLLVCPRCREQMSETDAYVSSMCEAAEEVRAHPEERAWRLSYLWGGVAAGASILVLGLLALRYYPPAFEVRLADFAAASAPAGRALDLRLDGGGVRLEIVNASGQIAWQGPLQAAGEQAAAPGQRRGAYLVRVRSRAGELRREYRLEIR